MSEKPIPKDHHVVRHCPRGQGIRENGVITEVFPEFFKLRAHVGPDKVPETYLSATYYEFFVGDPLARMLQCLNATQRKVADDEAMVRLNVGLMMEQGEATKKRVRVSHAAKKTNPAYSKVIGTGQPGVLYEELAALLAAKAVVEISMARDIRAVP